MAAMFSIPDVSLPTGFLNGNKHSHHYDTEVKVSLSTKLFTDEVTE